MRIRVLGPLEILDGALGQVAVAPKPRVILALLATHADSTVPTSCMVEELWENEPPRSAFATVQTYIGQLRRGIGAALGIANSEVARDVLVTEGAGYRLITDRIAVDLSEARLLERDARSALRAGALDRGAQLLRKALWLWRGPALVNVCGGRVLAAQVARLEEFRLGGYEQLVVAELQRGEHHSLVPDLTECVARHPLHESLHGHLALALYRCGRRAEALAVLRDLRTHLVEELGLEPAAQLAQLQKDILNDDPALHPVPSPSPIGAHRLQLAIG